MNPHPSPITASDASASASRLIAVLLIAACMSGCALFTAEKEKDKQAEDLYDRAKAALQQEHYVEALDRYKELEASFPFSPFAQSAAIERAYAHYKYHQHEETIVILDQFIKLNPSHPHLDYVYYLKGLAHYNYAQTPLNKLLRRDRTNKDPTPLIESFSAFKHLRETYPDSRYDDDARLRSIALRNMLAVYEIRIADYYMRRRAYLAVINRCKYVLEYYPGAQHTPEALVLLAEAYRRTDSPGLARDTLEVLELNYPGFVHSDGGFGRMSNKDRKNWLSNLKDLSDDFVIKTPNS